MDYKKVISIFLISILVSTFSFSYFSLPTNQFIEINEEENRHSSNSTIFSIQEYITENTNSNIFLFSFLTEINHQNKTTQFLSPIRKVIAPPPELV